MSFSQPEAQDATAVASQQQLFNNAAGAQQNVTNSYNQSNPYGSVQYQQTPGSPNGYTINTSLSAPEQQLLNTQQSTQNIAGTTGNQLAQNSAGMYSSPYDLNAASGQTANLLNNWQQKYQQPIFNQQQSNLNSQLQNQGLAPGSEAYNNAQNLLARNQGDVTNQYLTANEGQAFGQALQQYQLPLQTLSGLYGAAAPQQGTWQSPPQSTIQPPNYQAAAANQFNQQQQNFQNTIQGVGQIAGGIFGGGWA